MGLSILGLKGAFIEVYDTGRNPEVDENTTLKISSVSCADRIWRTKLVGQQRPGANWRALAGA